MSSHLSAVDGVLQIHLPLPAALTSLAHGLTPLAVLLLLAVVAVRFRFLRSTAVTCAVLGVVVGLSLTGRTLL
ncbi:hypothetical protein [Streptomyces sp. 8L]|uniref:hypothetical protein n=1 Tax=Streptomyces sp. 8L TaxID=2877242 RepID=UPI001CD803F7|nr:hypothetical protein [Streptomyces sp. 8L]MCA1219298.1 hypothetical protein [Streptomyces sp. 8L]